VADTVDRAPAEQMLDRHGPPPPDTLTGKEPEKGPCDREDGANREAPHDRISTPVVLRRRDSDFTVGDRAKTLMP
jgi:hypothetical protein